METYSGDSQHHSTWFLGKARLKKVHPLRTIRKNMSSTILEAPFLMILAAQRGRGWARCGVRWTGRCPWGVPRQQALMQTGVQYRNEIGGREMDAGKSIRYYSIVVSHDGWVCCCLSVPITSCIARNWLTWWPPPKYCCCSVDGDCEANAILRLLSNEEEILRWNMMRNHNWMRRTSCNVHASTSGASSYRLQWTTNICLLRSIQHLKTH